MAELGWHDAGEIKPREIAPNPRCKDFQAGAMFHTAH
jgi:hypothetical protein